MLNRFAQLSASEKRLSTVVAGLLGAALVMLIAFRCIDALDTLDATIEGQEIALMEFTKYASFAGPVEQAFDTMAKQHSSEWTQEQIHDRLRVEIARLSLRQVPQENTPIPAVSKPGDLLVDIRSWPVGALDDSGEGYRTYQINFRTEPTSIQNIAIFLERLQQSPQALRVNFLELTRQPMSTEVTAAFRVTRTVIGDEGAPLPKGAQDRPAGPAKNLARNADFAQWNAQDTTPPEWSAANATLAAELDLVAQGGAAVSIRAQGPSAEFYQVQQLEGGKSYEVQFDAKSSGAARMRVVSESTGAALPGEAPLTAGPGAYHYRFRFTVPGDNGVVVAMRVPCIVLEDQGAVLAIDNVAIEEFRAP